MALAAGTIFHPRVALINTGFFDVGIGPGIEIKAIEPYALSPDRKLSNMGPNGFVELVAAHAQVGRGCRRSQNARWATGCDARWRGCWHWFDLRHRCIGTYILDAAIRAA